MTDVDMTAAEAWDLRAIVDTIASLRGQVARHEAQAYRIVSASCARAGVAHDPDMGIHVEGDRVVFRVPEAVSSIMVGEPGVSTSTEDCA